MNDQLQPSILWLFPHLKSLHIDAQDCGEKRHLKEEIDDEQDRDETKYLLYDLNGIDE